MLSEDYHLMQYVSHLRITDLSIVSNPLSLHHLSIAKDYCSNTLKAPGILQSYICLLSINILLMN